VLLRESSDAAGDPVDLSAVVAEHDNGGGVAHGKLLLELAEAVLSGDAARSSAARRRLRRTLGDAAFVDTCATIASFNAVVKIADGSGIPLEDYKEENSREIRRQLSIAKFSAAD
jgi:hypothetical protein